MSWQWALRSGWKAYAKDESDKLEEAYEDGKSTCKINDSYEADFKRMVQYQIADPSKQRKIRRAESDSAPRRSPSPVSPARSEDESDEPPPKVRKTDGAGKVDLSKFYNMSALDSVSGKSPASAPAPLLDRWGNPSGVKFDLAREDGFNTSGFKVVVGLFYSDFVFTEEYFALRPGSALRQKGFTVTLCTSEKEFLSKLPTASIAWVISGSQIFSDPEIFATRLADFRASGGGLFLLADNAPYCAHASLVLSEICGTKVELIGDSPAGKIIKSGGGGSGGSSSDAGSSGWLKPHPITTGIFNFFEGVTISHPSSDISTHLDCIGQSSEGQGAIFASKSGASGGRVVLDCGFSKLYINYDTAGVARFISNVTAWLAYPEGEHHSA